MRYNVRPAVGPAAYMILVFGCQPKPFFISTTRAGHGGAIEPTAIHIAKFLTSLLAGREPHCQSLELVGPGSGRETYVPLTSTLSASKSTSRSCKERNDDCKLLT